jgi:hypothetical protein
MGTTLTGTTPATTYDSLIKVTDNGPLSGTAKYLSDGLGNDSALALSTGNIGIGTTSPSVALEVNGSVRFVDSTSAGPDLEFGNIGGSTKINNIAAANNYYGAYEHIFTNNDNSVERMRITSAGNVGIGNTIPSSFLSNGNQLVVGSGAAAQGITIYSDTSETGNLFFADGTVGDAAYRGFLRYSHDSDSMQIYTNGANERMRIDSTGNVGIGTSSPAEKLDVYGNLNFSIPDAVSVSAKESLIVKINSGNDQSNRVIDFRNYNTSLFSITQGGNVGIGTSSPDSNLHIKNTGADAKLTIETSDSYDAIINLSAASGEMTFGYDRTSDSMLFCASDNILSGERFRISPNGVTFNGDTAAANALDDYEEGTFTPTVAGDATGAFSATRGEYTKVGNIVTFRLIATISSNFTDNFIGGLPFIVGGLNNISGISGSINVANNSSTTLTANIECAGTSVRFYDGNSTATQVPPTTAMGTLRMFGTYRV